MRKRGIILFFLIGMSFILFGCGSEKEESNHKLSVVGSTSVAPLAEEEGKIFEQASDGLKVDIQSVGSSAGIKAAEDGTADIGMSSRYLKDSEKKELKETIIALDAIAIAVHKDNPVENLTKDQLTKIFKGEITNWSQVGGKDRPIVVISREEGSGTRTAFEELLNLQTKVEKGAISNVVDRAFIADGNGAVLQNVSTKENAIGYVSLGVINENIKAVKVEGVEPTEANVKNDSYQISRPYILLTKGEPQGKSKTFIDFVLSEKGQSIVEEEHYISIN